MTDAAWPADPAALDAGRAFLRERVGLGGRTVLVPDGDADGLSAALIVSRAVERMGGPAPIVVLPGRGEHVHRAEMRARIARARPDALIVVDSGSRAGAILPGLPTLVVDHHRPAGQPDGAVFVSAYGHPPVANTSLLAWHLCKPLADLDDLDWVALLGTVADLGADAPFEGVAAALARYGKEATRSAVARLNAPARAPGHRIDVAWAALLAARNPADIARDRVPGASTLDRLRRAVTAEVTRCARAAPLFAEPFALLAMHSDAKVHTLVAQRWCGRLRNQVVIAANGGWLPGRVNFAMRAARDVNLLDLLAEYPWPRGEEVGHGHPGATGGSLPREDALNLFAAMGFDRDVVEARLDRAAAEADPSSPADSHSPTP